MNGEDQRPEVPSRDSDARLDALNKERDSLREEVAQVRKSLEQLQERHDREIKSLREQLKDTHDEKEQAETQYRNLLGKVNTIRSQLGDRLKADAVSGDSTPKPAIYLCLAGGLIAGTYQDSRARGAEYQLAGAE